MLKVTNFAHDNSSSSSERTSIGGTSFTRKTGSQFGGVTFKSGNMISRFSNSGTFLGSEIRSGHGHAMYLDSHGGITDRLTDFVR